MPDREKVIKGLDRCKEGGSCDGCQYDIHSSKCIFLLHADAIALLKEQEAKTGQWIYKKYDDMFMCSCCEKYSIRNDYPYCHWCGARMEGR